MPLRAIPARILTTKLRKPTELMISSRLLRVIGERWDEYRNAQVGTPGNLKPFYYTR